MDSDAAPLVAEGTDLPTTATTATSDGGQITSLRNEFEKDNQHRLEMRKLKRDIYALNRANEDLQSKNQQLTIEFNGRLHEFTMQQLDLQAREIDQHLELIDLSTSLKAISGETDIALIAAKIAEQILIVEAMATRRVATSDTPTPSKKRHTGNSADSLGGEWSAMLEPVTSSSSITPPGVNTSRSPISTPSTPIRSGKRRGRPPKKSIDRTKVLDRRLGDYPDNHVMESRTLVWGKVPSYHWYPGIVLFDEDIQGDYLQVPIPVSEKFREKRLKTPHVPHFIIRFLDNTWACLPLSNLKMLGEIPELDCDMIALHSQLQGKWTGKRHTETQNAYKNAMDAIGSDSE
ncbi:hypothetical protein BDZ89DRAFT_1137677 [Hymenopellis radicata]|nr:hypothetical protein BDZ89DRAFT_1137677 [Hymenopellis radicata]